MMRFLDGPAAGVTLAIRRAPCMLRLVQTPEGDWDALDQLDDVAHPTEKIVVYRWRAKPSAVHLNCGRGKNRSAGGFYPFGDYVFMPDQPGDAITRDNAAWEAWCVENKDRLLREFNLEGTC